MPVHRAAAGGGGALFLVVLSSVLSCALGSAAAIPATLQCRLADGPWQRCRMIVAADGLAWTLELAGESIHFRHDGRGMVSMERQDQRGRHVQPRWLADASLCWDGVCARGAIPLD